MKRLVLISLDALSCDDLDLLTRQPFMSGIIDRAAVVRNVKTAFVSNTYPIHTSAVTGLAPSGHGVISNIKFRLGDDNPDWHWYARDIKAPTLYKQAKKCGMKTLSVMWPVTGQSGITYNIPEIFANRPWKNQKLVSLWAGSPLFSIQMLLKFGKQLRGISQPERDDFCTEVFCDAIKEKKPRLMMLHLTDTDDHKHLYGCESDEVRRSIERMDKRIEKVFKALEKAQIDAETDVIIMSDHAQLDVFETSDLNEAAKKQGIPNEEICFELCGGSAFALPQRKARGDSVKRLREFIENNMLALGVERFLTTEEMNESGYDKSSPFAVAARRGTEFEKMSSVHRATHGYPTDLEGYAAFYMGIGNGFRDGARQDEGASVLDICPTAAKLLGLEMRTCEKKANQFILREQT